jgi:integrase
VQFAHTEVVGRGIVIGPPKSGAGVRTVAVPKPVAAELVKHLAAYVDDRPDTLVFTGPKDGKALCRGSFSNLVRWVPTVAKLGVPGLNFHDLKHAGNMLAAQTGVSTKDLMARMGHDDMRAALIYQRATSEADRRIADQLGRLVDRHHGEEEGDEDGAAGALVPAS